MTTTMNELIPLDVHEGLSHWSRLSTSGGGQEAYVATRTDAGLQAWEGIEDSGVNLQQDADGNFVRDEEGVYVVKPSQSFTAYPTNNTGGPDHDATVVEIVKSNGQYHLNVNGVRKSYKSWPNVDNRDLATIKEFWGELKIHHYAELPYVYNSDCKTVSPMVVALRLENGEHQPDSCSLSIIQSYVHTNTEDGTIELDKDRRRSEEVLHTQLTPYSVHDAVANVITVPYLSCIHPEPYLVITDNENVRTTTTFNKKEQLQFEIQQDQLRKTALESQKNSIVDVLNTLLTGNGITSIYSNSLTTLLATISANAYFGVLTGMETVVVSLTQTILTGSFTSLTGGLGPLQAARITASVTYVTYRLLNRCLRLLWDYGKLILKVARIDLMSKKAAKHIDGGKPVVFGTGKTSVAKHLASTIREIVRARKKYADPKNNNETYTLSMIPREFWAVSLNGHGMALLYYLLFDDIIEHTIINNDKFNLPGNWADRRGLSNVYLQDDAIAYSGMLTFTDNGKSTHIFLHPSFTWSDAAGSRLLASPPNDYNDLEDAVALLYQTPMDLDTENSWSDTISSWVFGSDDTDGGSLRPKAVKVTRDRLKKRLNTLTGCVFNKGLVNDAAANSKSMPVLRENVKRATNDSTQRGSIQHVYAPKKDGVVLRTLPQVLCFHPKTISASTLANTDFGVEDTDSYVLRSSMMNLRRRVAEARSKMNQSCRAFDFTSHGDVHRNRRLQLLECVEAPKEWETWKIKHHKHKKTPPIFTLQLSVHIPEDVAWSAQDSPVHFRSKEAMNIPIVQGEFTSTLTSRLGVSDLPSSYDALKAFSEILVFSCLDRAVLLNMKNDHAFAREDILQSVVTQARRGAQLAAEIINLVCVDVRDGFVEVDDPLFTCIPGGGLARAALAHLQCWVYANRMNWNSSTTTATRCTDEGLYAQYSIVETRWPSRNRRRAKAFSKALYQIATSAKIHPLYLPLLNVQTLWIRNNPFPKMLREQDTTFYAQARAALQSYTRLFKLSGIIINAFKLNDFKRRIGIDVVSSRPVMLINDASNALNSIPLDDQSFNDQRELSMPSPTMSAKSVQTVWAQRCLSLPSKVLLGSGIPNSVKEPSDIAVALLSNLELDAVEKTHKYYVPFGCPPERHPSSLVELELSEVPVWTIAIALSAEWLKDETHISLDGPPNDAQSNHIRFVSPDNSSVVSPFLMTAKTNGQGNYVLTICLSTWVKETVIPTPHQFTNTTTGVPTDVFLTKDRDYCHNMAGYLAALRQRLRRVHEEGTGQIERKPSQLLPYTTQKTLLETIEGMREDNHNEQLLPWNMQIDDTIEHRATAFFNTERLFQALLYATAHNPEPVHIKPYFEEYDRDKTDPLVIFVRCLAIAHAMVYVLTHVPIRVILHLDNGGQKDTVIVALGRLYTTVAQAELDGLHAMPLSEIVAVIAC